MRRPLIRWLAAVAIGVAAIATVVTLTVATPPKNGSLTVRMDGLAAGMKGDVSLRGPGVNRVITRGTTITGLAAGTYQVVARTAHQGPIVAYPTTATSTVHISSKRVIVIEGYATLAAHTRLLGASSVVKISEGAHGRRTITLRPGTKLVPGDVVIIDAVPGAPRGAVVRVDRVNPRDSAIVTGIATPIGSAISHAYIPLTKVVSWINSSIARDLAPTHTSSSGGATINLASDVIRESDTKVGNARTVSSIVDCSSSGSVSVGPSLILEGPSNTLGAVPLAFSWGFPPTLSAYMGAKLSLTLTASAKAGCTLGPITPLEVTGPTFDLQLGWFPLFITPQFTITLSATASASGEFQAEAGATGDVSMSVGGTNSFSAHVQPDAPLSVGAGFTVNVQGRLNVGALIEGGAGSVYVWTGPSLDVQGGRGHGLTANACLKGGVTFNVFGKTVANPTLWHAFCHKWGSVGSTTNSTTTSSTTTTTPEATSTTTQPVVAAADCMPATVSPFGSAPVEGQFATGKSYACYSFTTPSPMRLQAVGLRTPDGGFTDPSVTTQLSLTDASGQALTCPSVANIDATCVVQGTVHVIIYRGTSSSYGFWLYNLSGSAGCRTAVIRSAAEIPVRGSSTWAGQENCYSIDAAPGTLLGSTGWSVPEAWTLEAGVQFVSTSGAPECLAYSEFCAVSGPVRVIFNFLDPYVNEGGPYDLLIYSLNDLAGCQPVHVTPSSDTDLTWTSSLGHPGACGVVTGTTGSFEILSNVDYTIGTVSVYSARGDKIPGRLVRITPFGARCYTLNGTESVVLLPTTPPVSPWPQDPFVVIGTCP